jgi:hypothetical protein
MKIKIILFLAVSAITTLSFTFASINTTKKSSDAPNAKASSAPIGGFMAEDKI